MMASVHKGLKREPSEPEDGQPERVSDPGSLGRFAGGWDSNVPPENERVQQVMSPSLRQGPAKVRALSSRSDVSLLEGEDVAMNRPEEQLRRLIANMTSEPSGGLQVIGTVDIRGDPASVWELPEEVDVSTRVREEVKEYQEKVLEEYKRRWSGAVSELMEQQEAAATTRQRHLTTLESDMMSAWRTSQLRTKNECETYRRQELDALSGVRRQCQEYVVQTENEAQRKHDGEIHAAREHEEMRCLRFLDEREEAYTLWAQRLRMQETNEWEESKKVAEQRYGYEVLEMRKYQQVASAEQALARSMQEMLEEQRVQSAKRTSEEPIAMVRLTAELQSARFAETLEFDTCGAMRQQGRYLEETVESLKQENRQKSEMWGAMEKAHKASLRKQEEHAEERSTAVRKENDDLEKVVADLRQQLRSAQSASASADETSDAWKWWMRAKESSAELKKKEEAVQMLSDQVVKLHDELEEVNKWYSDQEQGEQETAP